MGLLRWGLRLLGAVVAIPVLFYLASFLGAIMPNGKTWENQPAEVRIGLLRGLIHYDLLLPIDPALHADFAYALPPESSGWMIIGWGSEAFYTTAGSYADITASAVWQAATGDAAVLRIDHIPLIENDFPGLIWLDISQAQYTTLRANIAAEPLRDATGTPLRSPQPGFTATDSFWQAPGTFHLFRPCNQWLAEQLTAAGIPFGRWTPTAESVTLSLWWNARG